MSSMFVFLSCMDVCLFLFFVPSVDSSRPSRAASVAILPSALLVEHIGSVPVGRFSFQWVLQPECRLSGSAWRTREPELIRSHPNSAI